MNSRGTKSVASLLFPCNYLISFSKLNGGKDRGVFVSQNGLTKFLIVLHVVRNENEEAIVKLEELQSSSSAAIMYYLSDSDVTVWSRTKRSLLQNWLLAS